jgi:hypothetical protein
MMSIMMSKMLTNPGGDMGHAILHLGGSGCLSAGHLLKLKKHGLSFHLSRRTPGTCQACRAVCHGEYPSLLDTTYLLYNPTEPSMKMSNPELHCSTLSQSSLRISILLSVLYSTDFTPAFLLLRFSLRSINFGDLFLFPPRTY